MDKEEILKKSKAENKNKDVYELEVINKAQRIGGIAALIVTAALMTMERFVLNQEMNVTYWLIITSFMTGMWVYKAVKMQKLHEIFISALWGVLTILLAVSVVQNYLG